MYFIKDVFDPSNQEYLLQILSKCLHLLAGLEGEKLFLTNHEIIPFKNRIQSPNFHFICRQNLAKSFALSEIKSLKTFNPFPFCYEVGNTAVFCYTHSAIRFICALLLSGLTIVTRFKLTFSLNTITELNSKECQSL